jgi:hypothetical protein
MPKNKKTLMMLAKGGASQADAAAVPNLGVRARHTSQTSKNAPELKPTRTY